MPPEFSSSTFRTRWQERPLQCPRCQSHRIGQWGTYQYPYSQNIRTRLPTGDYASTIIRA